MKTPEHQRPGPDEPGEFDELFGASDEEAWLSVLRGAQDPGPLGRVGKFDLIGEVARGGQGVVYRGRRRDSEERVAIKRLLPGSLGDDRSRRRFEREIDVLAGLDHPGIVKVFEVEQAEGLPSLAMEWVEGDPITTWSAGRREAGEVQRVLERFLEVCDAVDYAHRNGVLHRDLKPSNILVDTSGVVRVLDFGIARVMGDEGGSLTGSIDFLGTPAYASPEQLAGEHAKVDTLSDVYSLGVLLYELLTGVLPSEVDRGIPALYEERKHGALRAPSKRAQGIDADLDAIALKALSFERSERYASVAALGEDVRRFLGGRPVHAAMPSAFGRARRWVRRNRGLSALGGLLWAACSWRH